MPRFKTDPNYDSRVRMMRQVRLDTIVDAAIYANAEVLAECARNIVEDLISQHTLVTLQEATELRAWYTLTTEKES